VANTRKGAWTLWKHRVETRTVIVYQSVLNGGTEIQTL